MNIREYSLAWRWTDPQHAVLPDDVLDHMVPVAPHEAAGLARHVGALREPEDFPADPSELRIISTAILSPGEGRAWLCFQQPDGNTPVCVCWDPACAIRTTWGIFTAHWNDFCYPFDDLDVWPGDQQWSLHFHGGGHFRFRRRKPQPIRQLAVAGMR